jgi:hypothetical protein
MRAQNIQYDKLQICTNFRFRREQFFGGVSGVLHYPSYAGQRRFVAVYPDIKQRVDCSPVY